MRILILPLSYNVGVFAEFMQCQRETWDSIHVDGIDTIYYYKGALFAQGDEQHAELDCPDEYEMMHWKFKRALDFINYHNYDFVFRTNSCSYIDKSKLFAIAEGLPRTGCYAGWDNGGYVSGAGIWFSPDVLDILKTELTDAPHGAEDVLIGDILRKRVTISNHQTRYDIGISVGTIPNVYHYRLKTSNIHEERIRDINNMREVHRIIMNR